MELSIEADKEFLRVRISGRDSPEPPSHVCAAVFRDQHSIALVHRTPVAQMANEFISVVADNRNLGVRNFRDVEQAAAWLRARPA